MLLAAQEDKQALIDQVVALSGDAVDPRFVPAFYRNVPPADLLARDAAAWLAAAASLWQFMAERRPGRAHIRVVAEPGHAVIEIVNDDMPFLVDSVTAALNGLDLTLQLLVHPVLTVKRDGSGHLLGLGSGQEGDLKESAMRIELTRPLDATAGARVRSRLEAVLADVRLAVIDWTAMRGTANEIADGLAIQPIPVPPDEAAEVAAFLHWLAQDNFIFLGLRDYRLTPDGMAVIPASGRGILRDDAVLVFDGLRNFAQLAPDVQQFLRSPQLLLVTKSNRRSTVHRPAPLDTVVLKTFDETGAVQGQHLLVGLFTSTADAKPPHQIPLLRRKIRRCLERSGFAPTSHDGKALLHVLDTYPRDELFPIDESDLIATALGIQHAQERRRIALFTRRDPFGRFVSCLVLVPHERYTPEVSRRMGAILAGAFRGTVGAVAPHLDETELLARIHFTIMTPGALPEIDTDLLEQALVEAGRTWADRLGDALTRARGDEHAATTLRRFAEAMPTAYTERVTPDEAVADIDRVRLVEQGTRVALALGPGAAKGGGISLKTFHAGAPIALSDVLPVLENFGLKVITENPYEVRPQGAAQPVWIQQFELAVARGSMIDLATGAAGFEQAFVHVWSGVVEDDGLNRLVLAAGLSVRQVVVLRCYAKILRQAGSSFSQAYMEDALGAHPVLARLLVRLFEGRFDPRRPDRGSTDAIEAEIAAGLDEVDNLDEDRILRSFLLLIRQSLRTNFYQRDPDGQPKPYLSIKLASRAIDLFPAPRPLVEIFVYSPRMEGCHLRGGLVARGGIRWSDRKEDFRSEILGLMKAQMVKNAVIVPVGSKGGFVVKLPPAGREALQAEVVACYRILMSGLLDLTDTIDGDHVVPPPLVVRHDGDDPYLVVAADKGTATFSDIANQVAVDYGFWLGDAFASGGSAGYDHKAMAITARGAWEAVKRHFRELGTDIQSSDFTVIGVGDMSGDVFGNGMLLSQHIRLVAAFDHRHVFIDPDPDASTSWQERQRLFGLTRSSWADYDPRLLSAGGAIYPRSAKSITLSPEARARLNLTEERLSPAELIKALLRQPVDLLWFGGIGTYVKAAAESHADAGDRANDALRVEAASLRAKVVGEGANLAVTQRGRIEYALRGGRLNTDAIDNSAGVDTSDHEVNIKVALADLIKAGSLRGGERDAFLASMTDQVADLVLRDNVLQTLALSLAEAEAAGQIDQHGRLIKALERSGRLDRALEFLPDDEALAQRAAARRGLTRPELAVLLAYGKLALYDALLASDLPDAPELEESLIAYFPTPMRLLDPATLKTHRLRREILATGLANQLLNRMGPAFVVELQARTSASEAEIARAFRISVSVFGLEAIWQAIEALDHTIQAGAQLRLLAEVKTVAERTTRWLLTAGSPLAIAPGIAEFAPAVALLAPLLPGLLPEGERHSFEARKAPFLKDGVPAELAERVVALANLAAGLDIRRVDKSPTADIVALGQLYYETGERFGLDTLRDLARHMTATNHWQRLALGALLDDFYLLQGEIARRALTESDGPAATRLEQWIARRAAAVARIRAMVAEIAGATPPDLAMLTVAARQLRTLLP